MHIHVHCGVMLYKSYLNESYESSYESYENESHVIPSMNQ